MNTALDTQAADLGAPSELQIMIADSVQRLFAEQVTPELLARFDAGHAVNDLWDRVCENGLPDALADEAAGGSGASLLDASPVLHAIGRWQAPLPLAETMLAQLLLSRAGLAVPDGAITLIQCGRHNDLRLSVDGKQLDGRVANVPWARACRWAVVMNAQQTALVDLRQASVTLEAGSNFANEERDTLVFATTPAQAGTALPLPGIDEPAWLLGALARACMMVGALESALEKSVVYANERVQFGKPIGKQQALQQQLAQMAGSIAAAHMSAQIALASASAALQGKPEGASVGFDVAVAKVCAGEAASLACSVAHQVHGAIGFTHEHTLHFATRRLWSWREEFGSDAEWAKELGRTAIAAGSAGFWAGLSARTL